MMFRRKVMVENVTDGSRFFKSRNQRGMFKVNSPLNSSEGGRSKAASRASCPLHIQLASSALLTFRLLGQTLMRDSPGGRQLLDVHRECLPKETNPNPLFSKHIVREPHDEHASAANISAHWCEYRMSSVYIFFFQKWEQRLEDVIWIGGRTCRTCILTC